MKIERIEAEAAFIMLSKDELIILNNALNEVCNGLDITDFSSRIGVEQEIAEKILEQIGDLIDRLEMSDGK